MDVMEPFTSVSDSFLQFSVDFGKSSEDWVSQYDQDHELKQKDLFEIKSDKISLNLATKFGVLRYF